MAQYATAYEKTAPVYAEFARPFLERHFAPEVVAALYDALPTYTRGPRKGLKKGYVHWTRCERGGWVRTGPSYHGSPTGHVMRPGTHNVRVAATREPTSTMLLDENANATPEMRIAAITERIAGNPWTTKRRYF